MEYVLSLDWLLREKPSQREIEKLYTTFNNPSEIPVQRETKKYKEF